jgi:hypothetical protein
METSQPTGNHLIIAVSGHRTLPEIEALITGIHAAVETLQRRFPEYAFTVLSCLAEGADRLLAGELIRQLHADLVVVLPMREDDYVEDFSSYESVQFFWEMMKQAKDIIRPEEPLSRPEAYRQANKAMLERCHLLVTLWDGLPARGPGGTGEMVEMTRKRNLPVFWIHTQPIDHLGDLTIQQDPLS